MIEVELPDGTVAEFPDGTSHEVIKSTLSKQVGKAAAPKTNSFDSFSLPGKNRSIRAPGGQLAEDVLVGAKHGWDEAAYGLKSLFTDLTPEEREQLKQGEESRNSRGLGAWAGYVLPSAVLGGGIGGALGKVGTSLLKASGAALPKVLQAGRFTSIPQLANAAATGGATAALTTTDKENRAANAAAGAALGVALPLAVSAVRPVAQWGIDEFSSKAGPLASRAYRMFEDTLGKKVFEEAQGEVSQHAPSILKLSTAAAADSPKLAALERGARSRNPDVWLPKDRQFQDEAYAALNQSLPNAGSSLHHLAEAKLGMDKAQLSFANKQLTENQVKEAVSALDRSLLTDRVRANPQLQSVVKHQMIQLSMPDAKNSANTLYEVSQKLKEFPELAPAAQAMDRIVDSATRGGLSKAVGKFKLSKEAQELSEAEESILNKFRSPTGTSVSEITQRNLAQARAAVENKAAQGQGQPLTGPINDSLDHISDALRRRELYREVNGITVTKPELDSILASGRNNPIYTVPGLRGFAGRILKNANSKLIQRGDDALVDPAAFEELIKISKDYRTRGLSENERMLLAILRAQAGTAGALQSE